MKNLLEFPGIVSILTVVGGLIWAGFGTISTSAEFGDGSGGLPDNAKRALVVAGIALVVFFIIGRIRKRR